MSTETSPRAHPRAAAIETATGASLQSWVERIDGADGRVLDHAAIARLLPERWDITEWWAQGVTVAYEQIIGRRVVGQSSAGDFAASASRTVVGDMDRVRDAWDAFLTPRRREELGLQEPSLTATDTWRYWRAAVADGSRLSVSITVKDHRDGSARSTVGIEHKGIGTTAGRDAWKDTWKAVLTDFAAAIAEKEHP
ncbi:hypothetical protein [Brachybacterium fresconis]|uniref:DUF4287 domain-containing protein n=1 Tax=Brachybacterium fresconis TaxID=173363 RepID=A0ABS4YP86_9MICO|nr:hypothetical protein [Brachybacterium fresconis]MBP2410569.1 hypothetical protein [Brachybacterium fresconis]